MHARVTHVIRTQVAGQKIDRSHAEFWSCGGFKNVWVGHCEREMLFLEYNIKVWISDDIILKEVDIQHLDSTFKFHIYISQLQKV